MPDHNVSRKLRIAVVTQSVEADRYVFKNHRKELAQRGLDVDFDIREIHSMVGKDYQMFSGYSGLLVHPGMSLQKSMLSRLQKLEGINWALYCLDIGDSEVISNENNRIFDITDLDGIVDYFIGEQK
ncbi:MAG: hypothetical protein AABX66_01095 [Nanoarchaeota archaeon]